MPNPRINLLSQETASKIAAGEVVEKPASVVKELVENAMDAGARNITVEIVNGGLDLIRVIDDGQGILNEDMARAFLPHATSKIRSIDDIFSISTLGFRGEALPSVAAVSRILLKSHAREDRDGMEIFVEGGEEKFRKYSAIDQGTIVDVRDLFYNVPARLKFLRTAQKEGANVTDIMTRLALSHPEIAFAFFNNEKAVFRTFGTGNLSDVIRTVYTRAMADHSSAFQREIDGITISGYIGNEAIARGSRNQQSIFINGRYVVSRQLTAAVEQAFKSFLTINKFPFFVLNLTIDPTQVDVNVHPQKAEIKFSDDRAMFKAVFDTVHGALRQIYQDSLGFVKDPAQDSEDSPELKTQEGLAPNQPLFSPQQGSFFGEAESPVGRPSQAQRSYQEAQSGLAQIRDPREFSVSAPEQAEVYGNVVSGDQEEQGLNEVTLPVDLKSFQSAGEGKREAATAPLASAARISAPAGDPWQGDSAQALGQAPRREEGSRELQGPVAKFPMPQIIGQFQKTYILAELSGTLYLVDQHAAHEKINFEHYMAEMLNQELVLQPLLVPEVLDLAMDDYSVYLENQGVFAAAGFTIEEFGGKTLSIREVPLFLSAVSVQRYFGELLDNLKNLGKGSTREVRYLRIATAACKASVKARDELSRAEMEHLLHQLRFLDEPFTCPHGRPTMIRFTLTEIEKMFRRIQ